MYGFTGVKMPRSGNSIIGIDYEHDKVHDKRFYDYQDVFEQVPNNGTVRIDLKATTKNLHLILILDCEGKSRFRSYAGTTYTDTGLSGAIFNRFIDDAPLSTAEVKYNVVANVLGSLRFNKLILGGTGPNSTGGTSQSRIESVLSEGQNLYIQVTNVSGQAKDIGVTLEWYE